VERGQKSIGRTEGGLSAGKSLLHKNKGKCPDRGKFPAKKEETFLGQEIRESILLEELKGGREVLSVHKRAYLI